jgi:hypothetical protein
MGCEVENVYDVFNPYFSLQMPLFRAMEHTSCINRMCCGPQRSFNMTVSTVEVAQGPQGPVMAGREVLNIDRPWRCGPGSCCYRQEMSVMRGSACNNPNWLLGRIEQQWNCCDVDFILFNAAGNPVYNIHGDCCTCGTWSCRITAIGAPEVQLGEITKTWGGLGRELFTDADNFVIVFPPTAGPGERVKDFLISM